MQEYSSDMIHKNPLMDACTYLRNSAIKKVMSHDCAKILLVILVHLGAWGIKK